MRIKLIFDTPENSENPEKICWHNLEAADKYHLLSFFCAATRAWFKLHPDKNYQDLEKELRSKNLQTHIIAGKIEKIPDNARLGLHKQDSIDYKYECIFSCRPKEKAMEELLTHWKSYDENFEKLALSGTLILKSPNDSFPKSDPSFHQFDQKEIDIHSQISQNLKKIFISELE